MQANNVIADANNKNNADANNSLLSVVNNQNTDLEKQETIKDNTKIIADNTNLATDYLKDIKSNTMDLDGLNSSLDEANKILADILKKPDVGGGGGTATTNALISDTNKALADIKKSLEDDKTKPFKTFCELNPQHNDCREIIKDDSYSDIFSSPELSNMKEKTEAIKTELRLKMNEFKNLLGNPSIAAGNDIDSVDFTLKHAGTSIDVKNDAFQIVGLEVRALVLAFFAVFAFMIIVRK